MTTHESTAEMRASWRAQDAFTAVFGRPLTEAEHDVWDAAWTASREYQRETAEREIAEAAERLAVPKGFRVVRPGLYERMTPDHDGPAPDLGATSA